MFPASEWQLIRYARYVANMVTSYDTVVNYISGVRTLHRLGGFTVIEFSSANLAHILKGLKHELARPVRQAVPVTPDLLRRMYNWVDMSSVKQIVCYTALLMGFYLFLRKSNLVPESATAFNEGEQLVRSDVKIGRSLVLIEIKWSKTLQFKEKLLLLPLIPAKDKRICPVFWLRMMMSLVQAARGDPLFMIPTKNGVLKPLTYDQLTKQFKQWVAEIGEDPQEHSLHGLRRGGACHALESGLVGEDIKIMGDWASLAYMKYLDQTLQRRVKNMVQFMENV